MSLLDAFITPELKRTETVKALIEARQKFEKELGCNWTDIQIRILYAKDGNPYFILYHATDDGSGKKKWKEVRHAKLDEII